MRVTLVDTERPSRKTVLRELPALIGQDPSADVQVPDSWVGRFQCILDEDQGVLRVLDLGSRTGTFVNGVRTSRADVFPGDRLTVGTTVFAVYYRIPADARITGASRGNRDP